MFKKAYTFIALFLIALIAFNVVRIPNLSQALAQESSDSAVVSDSSVTPSPDPSPGYSPEPSATVAPTPSPEVTPAPTAEPTVEPTSEPEVTTTPAPTPNESPNPPPLGDVELVAVVVENTSAESVESLDLDPVEASSAQLVTDKADYAPTDTAVISGTGLSPNTTYIITVSSTDEPAVTHTENVTTNENGNFVYAYQLDGTYRPNYSVVLKDQAGNTVATTTFTDAVPVDFKQCANDRSLGAGVCDWIGSILQSSNSVYFEGMSVPQRILYRNVGDGVHTITFKYSYTKGGIHAYDFITSLDQGNGGFSPGITNLNLCQGLGGADSTACTALSPTLGGGTPVSIPSDAFDSKDSDPTPPGTGTSQTAKETAYASVNGTRNIQIHSSGTINSASIDPITHDVAANGDTGDSNVQVTIDVDLSGCGGSGCSLLIYFGGHLAVGGSDNATGTNWGPGLGSSFISGGPYHIKDLNFDGGGGSLDNQIQGASILVPLGSITLDKVTDPLGNTTSFDFSTTNLPTPTNLSLQDSSTPVTWSNLTNGTTYTITETLPAGWALSASCTGGTNSTITNITNGVSITLNGGDDITCTFTNTLQTGHLIVHKVTDPSSDTTTDFSITASGTGTISGDVTRTINGGESQNYEVTAGTYSVSEDPVTGWVETDNTCENVAVGAGETKECTITNVQIACYPDFTKTFVISGAGKTQFTHDKFTSGDWKFVLIYSVDGVEQTPVDFVLTNPGAPGLADLVFEKIVNIPVDEDLNWSITLDSWRFEVRDSDTNGLIFNSGNVLLSPEIITPEDEEISQSCTKLNTIVSPVSTAQLHKVNDVNGDGLLPLDPFFHTEPMLEGWTFVITDALGVGVTAAPTDSNGTTTFQLDLGTYTISEIPQDGWEQTYPKVGSIPEDCSTPPSLNICTPNSDGTWTVEIKSPSFPITLDFGNTQKGHIIVDKVTDPPQNDQLFNFNTIGVGYSSFSLTDTDTPNDQELVHGTYSVSEVVPPGWDLTNTTCVSSIDDTESAGSLELDPGETITCTFTNQKDANIIVVKETDPDGSLGSFEFDPSYGDNFSLSDGQQNDSGDLNPGTYSVAELTPEGWDQTSATCSDGSPVNSIDLQAGETVTCTFGNQEDANIVVIKQTLPEGDPQIFDFTASYDNDGFSLADNGSNDSGDLIPGTYSVSETGENGWDLTNTTCVSSKGDTETAGSISLQAGETVTCTFTNTKRAHIIIQKNAIPDGSQVFTFNNNFGNGNPATFNLTDTSAVGFPSFDAEVLPGEYSVSENQVAGWQSPESTSCTNDETVDSINVAPGETVTCTFVNEKLATITLVKNTVGGNDTFNFLMTGVGLPAGTSLTTIANTDSETFNNLNPDNTYSISELETSGWALTGSNCTGTNTPEEITPNAGEEITCTFTNGKLPTLTLEKTVVNDNAGTATEDSFQASINTTEVDWDTPQTLDPGDYTASETTLATYTASDWGGNCAANGTVTLEYGDEKSCTITNDDKAPSLTLVKEVTNNNGGTALASDWTLTASGPTGIGGTGPAVTSDPSFDQGLYTLSELGPSGYSASSWSCEGGQQNGDQVTIGLGEDVTCTITNNDNAPSLTLVKEVVNDNGGTALPSAWTLTAAGPTGIGGTGPTVSSDPSFDQGTYTLSESGPFGYSASDWNCSGTGTQTGNQIALDLGETATCIITNDDIQPQLTVIKTVVNDNGGNAIAANFTMTVLGVGVSNPIFPGDEGGTTVYLNVGDYEVGEIGPSGYTMSTLGDCDSSIDIGESKTCTIINDDQPAHIQLTKIVNNDDGGNAVPDDFDLTINGAEVLSGSTTDVNSNTSHNLNETVIDGYAFTSITGDAKCPAVLGGTVTLDEGETVSCTITNDDIAPKIVLTKNVINDNGGTAIPDDFDLAIDTTVVGSGTTNPVSANFAHEINETVFTGYSFVSITGDEKCPAVLGGTVTLNEGEVIGCTITNNDLAPSLTLTKHVTNDNGGTATPADWFLTADGSTGIGGSGPSISSDSTFSAGVYTLSENGSTDYSASDWSCTGGQQNGNQITIGLDEDVTCEITNDDVAPSLTLVKEVVNDHGGTALASDWTLTAAGPTGIGGTGPTVVSDPSFYQGTYTFSEVGPSGYSPSSWDCEGGSQNGDQISLGLGESAVCTITNDDIQPQLVVIKHVINDHNGPMNAPDFGMTVLGIGVSNPFFPGDEAGTTVYLNQGPYSVGEFELPGYDMSSSADCIGSIAVGETKECTITNNDQPAQLIVHKVIIPPIFLATDPGIFDILVDGDVEANDVVDTDTQVFGVPPDTSPDGSTPVLEVSAGNHTISEVGVGETDITQYGGTIDCSGTGFILSSQTQEGIRDITLENGANVECTITNAFGTLLGIGQLSIIKNTIGGDDTLFDYEIHSTVPGTIIPDDQLLDPTNFSITTIGNTGSGLKTITAAPGFPAEVNLEELTPPSGWDFTDLECITEGPFGGGNGQSTFEYDGSTVDITFFDEENVTCTFTNTKRGTLTIVKDADPNDLTDFNFTTTGEGLSNFTLDDDQGAFLGDDIYSNSQQFLNLVPGSYSVNETLPNQFWTLASISCLDADAQQSYAGIVTTSTGVTVDLQPGKNVVCTFINEKESPTRTQGFWQTHTNFTNAVFSAQFPGGMLIGSTFGSPSHKGIITNIQSPAGQSQLFGAYYSNISQKSIGKGKGAKRKPIDQARMQLLQQLVTAKLNCAAFGCTSSVQTMIATADAAYAGNSASAILASASALDAYNNSGDTIIFSPPLPVPGNATPQNSKSLADIVFWDAP